MGTRTSIASGPVWYYQDSKGAWIPFKDIDNEMIEEAKARQAKEVELDDALIDLTQKIRRDKQNSSMVTPIKCDNRRSLETTLRTQRFNNSPILVKSFSEADSNDHRFIQEWKKKHRRMSVEELLTNAAKGILEEGKLLGHEIEAGWIAQHLQSSRGKSTEDIDRCVISLYTRESFLYRLVNTTLRENDQSKLESLGPFCYLLFLCDCSPTMGQYGYAGELYRGAQLDESTIQSYEEAVGTVKTWDAFSSTSKVRAKAENYGNVLFIINRLPTAKYRFSGMDVSSLSTYPEEDEVLVRASRNFVVEKVEKDEKKRRYRIYLSLC